MQINKKIVNRVHNILDTKAAKYTQLMLIFVIGFLVIWDIYLYWKNESTISRIIFENAKNNLFVITWVWGILAAHLFVARKRESIRIPEIIAIVILILVSIIIFLLGKFIPIQIPQYMHFIFLTFGGVVGYYLWPQIID